MKIETVNKRIRRDHRYILVDDLKTANAIRDYCMENLMDDVITKNDSTIRVWDKWAKDPKVRVLFCCTKIEWERVMEHYDLVRAQSYRKEKGRMIRYDYELNSNKGL